MSEVTPSTQTDTTAQSEEAAFDEVIAGAMSSFATTLAFPLIQKVTEDIKENSPE